MGALHEAEVTMTIRVMMRLPYTELKPTPQEARERAERLIISRMQQGGYVPAATITFTGDSIVHIETKRK